LPLYLPLSRQMKPRGQFQITEFENPNKSTSWRVTGTKLAGERVRENFKTEAEALGRKQELEIEASNFEPDHRIATTRLTKVEIADAETSLGTLRTGRPELKDKSLAWCVQFALDNYQEVSKEVTMKDALADFIKERTANGDRPLTIRSLKQRVGSIDETKLVSAVMESDADAAISKPGRGPVARNNERRALLQFFNWATKKKYCAKNPVAGIEPIKHDQEEPQILPVEKVRALLNAAATYKEGALLPYVAISLFAGVRPTELSRITWANINLTRGTITIGDKAAKLRARRVVDMACLTEKDGDKERKIQSNLIDWLLPYAVEKPPIVGKNWRRDMDRVKEIAGLVTRETAKSATKKPKKKKGKIVQARRYWKKLIPVCWCPDILRHTAVSNHFAQFENEGKTASWAGNSPDMIHRFYKGLVERADAEEFWSIRPDENVIALNSNCKIAR
jgi:integrase